jgi:hypothetical protein
VEFFEVMIGKAWVLIQVCFNLNKIGYFRFFSTNIMLLTQKIQLLDKGHHFFSNRTAEKQLFYNQVEIQTCMSTQALPIITSKNS